jgi:hypothetical protein
MTKKKLTREQVIRALRRLEKGWPDDLWLFAANSTLCLMEKTEGKHGMTNDLDKSGSIDQEYILEIFEGVDVSGGDW